MNLSLRLKLPSAQAILRLIPLSTLVILLGVLASCMVFLYQQFYETIAEVKVVHILQSQISLSQVDLPLYQTVTQSLNDKMKTDPTLLQNLPDPFIANQKPGTGSQNQPGSSKQPNVSLAP